MYCPKCGAENVAGARFCGRCWSALEPDQGGPPPPGAPTATPNPSPPPDYAEPGFGQQPQWPSAPVGAPYSAPQAPSASARSLVAFVLGIIGIVIWCPAFPIAAIVVGKMELNAIGRGESSPAGHMFAKVGFILGIVFASLQALFWVVYGAFIFVMIMASIAGAAS